MKSVIAFDLDGTITAANTAIDADTKEFLLRLSEKYRIVIIGAGYYERILSQTEHLPCDVLGNYGMQYAEYSEEEGRHILKKSVTYELDREDILRRADDIFSHFSLFDIEGERVYFHPSGFFSLALLGTDADKDKRRTFDPTRDLRREMHEYVSRKFPDYTVYLGGETSLDVAPGKHSKYTALCEYCEMHGIDKSEAVFCGDDYGRYGNDESVYLSDVDFIAIDDYRTLKDKLAFLLQF